MDYTDVLINIRKIVRSVNLESKRIQKEFGISIPQLLCLHYLSGQPQYQATVGSIAAYLKLNMSTVTGIIGRLEKKNLVARLPKSGDKRKTIIILTSHGFNLLGNSPELLHQQLSRKLSSFTNEQLTDLKKSLHLLVHAFELTNEEASPLITIDDFMVNQDDLQQDP